MSAAANTNSANTKSRRSDLRVLWHMLAHPVRGNTHAERLESFYRGQASDYDSFRARLLHGRPELIQAIRFFEDGVWVDMGAGTGENVIMAGQGARSMREIHLVDLSPSLLQVAEKRMEEREFCNVQTHLSDATTFTPRPQSVDLVTFSYSLTMIPDWFEAIRRAEQMLRPGGTIAVTDFFVSRKYAGKGRAQHGWLKRAFWTHWFSNDNVFLSSDHMNMLCRRFETVTLEEKLGKVPYLPFFKAPYYVFVGKKPSTESNGEQRS